jgi:uncharacterized protein YegL
MIFGKKNASSPMRTVAKSINLVKEPSGAPAVNLQKVRDDGHVNLAKRADTAGIALSKRGLAGIRAEAVLVLDHSGSMYRNYASGEVQKLVERALAFALQIDVDGSVPVIPFDGRILPTVNVGIHNYQNVVADRIWRGKDMGSTDLAGALEVVQGMAAAASQPLFVIVVTDGEPNDRAATTKVVCNLARYPVFLKFLALEQVHYLAELDDLGDDKRLLDNVDAKPDAAGVSLLTCSDMQFAEAMADEWDTWLAAATKAGVLT